VTVLDSRPDPEYIRSLARGDDPPKGIPARPRGTCPLCAGPAAASERRRPGLRLRVQLPEHDEEQPPADPRYAWLPF